MGWLDALGWAGSALLVFSLMQARVLRFRVLNTIACVILVVFNGVLGIWPMVAMNVVLAAINLWFIRTLVSQRHDDVAYQVIEVGPGDAWLNHLLRDAPTTSPGSSPASRGSRQRAGSRSSSCGATRPSVWSWSATPATAWRSWSWTT